MSILLSDLVGQHEIWVIAGAAAKFALNLLLLLVIQSTDVEDLTIRLVLAEVHALVRIFAHAHNRANFHSEVSLLVVGSVFRLLCFFLVTLRA